MSEISNDSGDLSANQQLVLDGFSIQYDRICSVGPVATAREVAKYDQMVAGMREKVTGSFDLELRDEKEFYDVMAGIVIGTSYMEQLIEPGISPQLAAEVTRMALAGLRPNR